MAKDYYDEKRVSNSSLSWFQRSPKYFKMMLDGELETPTYPWLEYGQELHMYILEPEQFDEEYLFLNYTAPKSSQQKEFCETFANAKKGKKEEKLLKAYKQAYSTKENDEKILEKAEKLEHTFKDYIKYIKFRHK